MKKYFKGIKISVIGLGRSGAASANLARSVGARVLVSDINNERGLLKKFRLGQGIRTELGRHSEEILESDLIIKSPGVPNDAKILLRAREKNIPIWSEIEFALKFIKPKKIFAVTGTNGKTTVTTLLGEMLKESGHKTVVGGNIGRPLSGLVERIDSRTNLVLEVSSYQLEDSFNFHPNICSVLNITPDHTEHHHSMKYYVQAKARIFRNQTGQDFCILNYDDPLCRKLAVGAPSSVIFFSREKALRNGVYFSGGIIRVNLRNGKYRICPPFKIPGMHNIENIMAAAAMASAARVSPSAIKKAVRNFSGVEHRIEFVEEVNGAKYYNDSKGTNVDSTRVALESFDGNVWLILGGRGKGSPYGPLKKLIRKKVKGVLLIGEAAAKIKKELAGSSAFYEAGTLRGAVKKAFALAKQGDIILLSPACASFDQFADYEDRGRQFKSMVKDLK